MRAKFPSFLLLFFLLNQTLAASNWRELSPGLDYQDLGTSYLTPWSHIHVFRINPQSYQFSMIMAKDLHLKHASAEEYAQHTKAMITINGGFFDNTYQPLGLRIVDKQQKSPLKQISWWGVFYIKNNKPYVSGMHQFNKSGNIQFAIQSGPRLLINGNIPSLKPGRAQRSALGIDKKGRILILVTDNAPLSTTELAEFMRAPPLNCKNALNLDGGSSSQLTAQIDSFQLNVHGFSKVSDAIIIRPQ